MALPHAAAELPSHRRRSTTLVAALTGAEKSLGLRAVADVDMVLVRGFPPTVPQPDVLVTTRDVLLAGQKNLRASDVLLAVEIVSPGSGRTDRIAKLADYADAGIPHYWIVDIIGAPERPTTLDAHVLDGDLYRRIVHVEGGAVTLTESFEVVLDLDTLVTG